MVGVIGLGSLGEGMARSVLRAGLPLVVCDVRPEATEAYREEAEVAGSPADLARRADAVIVAVVDDEQVHAVLSGPEGGLAAARPGTVFVVVSTISTECVEAIGAEASAAGVAIVDCGVSGGPAAAASGDLVCMVGGDPDVGRAGASGARGHRLPHHPDGSLRLRASRQSSPAIWSSTARGSPPTRVSSSPRRPESSCPSSPRPSG